MKTFLTSFRTLLTAAGGVSRLRSIVVAAVLACLLSQQAAAADKWISMRTRNFVVLGNGSEADVRRASRHLEELRAAVAGLFPKLQQPSTVQTMVFVFRNDESFRPYKPVAGVTGFFKAGDDLHYLAVTGPLNSQGPILHDYVHTLLRDAAGTLPVWAAEGLAEHFSTLEMGGRENEFTVGRTPARHVRTYNENQFIPLQGLFTLHHGSPEYDEKTKQGLFYAESSALIHYLTSGTMEKRQPQLVKFLNLLSQDRSLGESFNEAFDADLPSLEKELRDYLRGRTSLTPLKITPRETALVDRSAEIRTLSEAQVQYHLGDLLIRIDRFADAEAHLKAALAADSGLAAANASLALLRVRQRQFEAAVPFIQRALDADPASHLAHYYAAHLMQEMIDNGDPVVTKGETTPYGTMRAHLLRCIELAPQFVEAYGLLGHISLAEGENLREAETMLRKALAIAPGRHDISLKLAEALLRTEQTPAGKGLLDNLGRVSTDPAVRSRALNMIEQLDMRESFFKELGASETAARPAQPNLAAPAQPETSPASQPGRRESPRLEVLTPLEPQVEGEKVEGLLILLDCTKGLSMRVQTRDRVIQLHSSMPDRIQFLSYTSDVSENIRCGPRNPGTPVRITYRSAPSDSPPSAGEPLVVEFLQK